MCGVQQVHAPPGHEPCPEALSFFCPVAALLQVRGALFVYCCVWSIGALLVQQPEARERDRFDALMKQLAALGTIDSDRVPAGQLPAQSLYEYCFDVADGCWRSWRSYVTAFVPPPGGHFSKILVSTADTVRWVGECPLKRARHREQQAWKEHLHVLCWQC